MAENTPLPEVHLTHSPTIGAIGLALAKAQGVIESAPKDHTAEVTMKSGGKYTYSYADLAGVWDAGRGPLSANELALTQAWTLRPDGLAMTTLLVHSSGEWFRGEMTGFPVPDRSPQGVGTSITYARRYNVGAMVGVVSEEDDDGGNGGKPKARSSRPASAEGDARPSSGGAPTTFPNFGKAKGEPIRGAAVEALEFHLANAQKSLADPEKAKWHARDSALIGAIETELKRRLAAAVPEGKQETKSAPTEKPSRVVDQQDGETEDHAKQRAAGAFYHQAVKLGTRRGWTQDRVGGWLRRDRCRATKTEVTAADVAAFERHLDETSPVAGDGPGPGREPEDDAPAPEPEPGQDG